MAFITKEWKDRIVEYAGRRKLVNVSDQSEMIVDVTRNEGTVSQAGDAFSAANMNDLEQRVADEFSTISENLNVIQGDIDAIVPTFYNEVSVSSVFPFTAPHTGVICVTIYPQSDATLYLNLALYDANNTVVLGEALDIWGGNGGAQNTASCVVPKGYTLKIIRGPSNIAHICASFTPLKND
ncbi:MAG: hypothetical protein E7300_01045 [Lachnospiraceae bacterium]|nr:hypothetical protein [Lachnospiraceae bacterium]